MVHRGVQAAIVREREAVRGMDERTARAATGSLLARICRTAGRGCIRGRASGGPSAGAASAQGREGVAVRHVVRPPGPVLLPV